MQRQRGYFQFIRMRQIPITTTARKVPRNQFLEIVVLWLRDVGADVKLHHVLHLIRMACLFW